MEESHVTRKIVNLTLEILYLLTGEHFGPVKHVGSTLTPSSQAQFSGGHNRSQSLIMEPLPPFLIPEGNSMKKILEITQKIIELLTGEVPIRCQDVAVSFGTGEEKYLGCIDPYKDIMMEKRPPLTSPDDSRNTPERCPRPLYSRDYTQEHQEIPQEHQTILEENLGAHQVQVKEEAEDPSVMGDEPCKEQECSPEMSSGHGDIKTEEEEHVRIKEEEIPLKISSGSNGEKICAQWGSQEPSAPVALLLRHPFILSNSRRSPLICVGSGNGTVTPGDVKVKEAKERFVMIKEEDVPPEISSDGVEDDKVMVDSQEDRVRAKLHVHNTALSSAPPMVLEHLQGQPHPLPHLEGCIIPKKFPCSECGKYFTDKAKVAVHQRLHTGERPFFCSDCGKRFTRSYSLREHQQRAHAVGGLFSCPQCGISFTQKSDLLRHQVTHTEEKMFKCSRCSKCFLRKSCLVRHEKTHRGDITYAWTG